MSDKIYVVTASANKGQGWIICKALYGGILGSDIKKTAQAMLEEEYQDIKYHGRKIPRKYFKLVEYSADNTELLKQIEQLQAENAELKSSLTHANEECLKWHERAQNLLKDSGGSISGYEKKISDLQSENAALRERLGKWAVDNEIVMEPRVKDGKTYYVISRKERRIVTHYICTELTPEAAEARLKELKGEEE